MRNIIKKQGVVGSCDYCSHENVFVYDTSMIPNPVADEIIGLI